MLDIRLPLSVMLLTGLVYNNKQPVQSCERRLTHVISRMASTIITWPNEEEKQEARNFFQMKGFSNVIGAIDGSHIYVLTSLPQTQIPIIIEKNIFLFMYIYFFVCIIFLTEF